MGEGTTGRGGSTMSVVREKGVCVTGGLCYPQRSRSTLRRSEAVSQILFPVEGRDDRDGQYRCKPTTDVQTPVSRGSGSGLFNSVRKTESRCPREVWGPGKVSFSLTTIPSSGTGGQVSGP